MSKGNYYSSERYTLSLEKSTVKKILQVVVLSVIVLAALYAYNAGGAISDFGKLRLNSWLTGFVEASVIILGASSVIFMFIKPSLKRFLLLSGIIDIILYAWQYWLYLHIMDSSFPGTDLNTYLITSALLYFAFFAVVFALSTLLNAMILKTRKNKSTKTTA